MSQNPDLSTASTAAELPAPRERRGRGLWIGLIALAVIVSLAYFQREPLERQWQAWTGAEGDLPEPPELALPAVAGVQSDSPEGRRPAPTDPAIPEPDSQRMDADTLRERVVTDPEEAQARLERLAAARERSRQLVAERAARNAALAEAESSGEVDTPVDPAINAARRQAVPQQGGTRVVAQAPERPQLSAPDPAEAARIQERLREAARRRELAMQEPATSEEKARADGGASAEAESMPAPRDRGEIQPMPTDPSLASEAAPGAAESTAPWTPEAAEYVHAWELPLSVRRNMPALALNIHVFAERPEDRFVLINGERFVAGDELVEGARLVDIRREGAVVDFRDYRFLLEP
ncbi:general secretion pathway protein GspB [Wenzhouxiangella marina]|nr:general secretion pathway protein GspB [Wenzhouxiangella marina]MBB6086270.1 hypothetical protein [Wenzhouxiangella marina]